MIPQVQQTGQLQARSRIADRSTQTGGEDDRFASFLTRTAEKARKSAEVGQELPTGAPLPLHVSALGSDPSVKSNLQDADGVVNQNGAMAALSDVSITQQTVVLIDNASEAAGTGASANPGAAFAVQEAPQCQAFAADLILPSAAAQTAQLDEIAGNVGGAAGVVTPSAIVVPGGSIAESALLARTEESGFVLGSDFGAIKVSNSAPKDDSGFEILKTSEDQAVAKAFAQTEPSKNQVHVADSAADLQIQRHAETAQADFVDQTSDIKEFYSKMQAGNSYGIFLGGAGFLASLSQQTPDFAQAKSLPATVPAQLIQHSAAAKAGPVELLLTPDDLGHLKFQIHHEGETVRVVLAVERPETLDFLRRHGDQLLQEFRQAGFSGATLSFGEWSQQDRGSAPKAPLFDSSEVEFESLAAPLPRPALATPSDGRGLNLRL